MDPTPAPLIPQDGWHCLHLFYRIEYGQWQLLNPTEQRTAKIALSTLVQETRALPSTQLLTLSQVTPKADLGFMLITPDLHAANRIEKQLTLSLGADVLVPVYSYLSLTEESEYTTSDEQYAQTLATEQKLKPATPEFEAAMQDFRERMKKYRQDRVYPTLPDWPVVCFYNMTKRRGEEHNWYSLPFEERRDADGRTRARWPPIRRESETAHHRLDRSRRCRMGRDAFRARHLSDQSDRLPDALRRGERGLRRLRRILHWHSAARSTNCSAACSCSVVLGDRIDRRRSSRTPTAEKERE